MATETINDSKCESKKCNECGQIKSLDSYHKSSRAVDGKQGKCKECTAQYMRQFRHRNRQRLQEYERNRALSKYGLTPEDYQTMLADQDGRCAICRTDKSGGRSESFHVDHNHITGEVRGLLCSSCNRCLGLVGDSIATLAAAVAYLSTKGSYG